jgi:KDO2-lipid IV(A) lauroyltransferase
LHVAGGDKGLAIKLARRSFSYYGLYLIDFLRFISASREELLRRVGFSDWGVLDEARDGSGMLFVTIHFGNWDLGAAALLAHGYPVSVIADRFSEPRMNELVLDSRRHIGMKILPSDRSSLSLMRALRRNELVAALIDIPDFKSGVEVEFFNGTISVPDGLARLALYSKAAVVVGTVPRIGPWSDRVVGQVKHIDYELTGDRELDVRGLTQAIFNAVEEMVRAHPEQWYIFRHLWVEDLHAETVG